MLVSNKGSILEMSGPFDDKISHKMISFLKKNVECNSMTFYKVCRVLALDISS